MENLRGEEDRWEKAKDLTTGTIETPHPWDDTEVT